MKTDERRAVFFFAMFIFLLLSNVSKWSHFCRGRYRCSRSTLSSSVGSVVPHRDCSWTFSQSDANRRRNPFSCANELTRPSVNSSDIRNQAFEWTTMFWHSCRIVRTPAADQRRVPSNWDSLWLRWASRCVSFGWIIWSTSTGDFLCPDRSWYKLNIRYHHVGIVRCRDACATNSSVLYPSVSCPFDRDYVRMSVDDESSCTDQNQSDGLDEICSRDRIENLVEDDQTWDSDGSLHELSGFRSRWINERLCKPSRARRTCSIIIEIVFGVNLRPQKFSKSSTEGPRRSMANTLYASCLPK